jgi:hypothetical protein
MLRLGIRLQLMLWYTAVFAALLLFTGAFFYQHLEHSLRTVPAGRVAASSRSMHSSFASIKGPVTSTLDQVAWP